MVGQREFSSIFRLARIFSGQFLKPFFPLSEHLDCVVGPLQWARESLGIRALRAGELHDVFVLRGEVGREFLPSLQGLSKGGFGFRGSTVGETRSDLDKLARARDTVGG